MENKYNNRESIDIPEDTEEKSLAISEWSENNKHLENAITNCIDNNIPTFASCAGHEMFDSPYLSLKVNKNNLGRILNIMNSALDINSTSIALSYMEKQGTILTVTTDMLHKNKVFDKIAEASREEINVQGAIPEVKELYNMHKNLRIHYQEHEIEVKRAKLFTTIIIRPYTQTFSEYILDKLNIKRAKQPHQLTYIKRFIGINKLKGFASDMINMVHDTFKESTKDALFGLEEPKQSDSIKQRVKHDVNYMNLERAEKSSEIGENDKEKK